MAIKYTLENAVQAKQKVEELEAQGHSRDEMYLFAHSKDREGHIADVLDTEKVGMSEQGFFKSMKNAFSKRGDQLRSDMHAAGLTEAEAETAEEELDNGKLILIVNK
ncbi:general stress protein [Chryseomicrobium palamuruense]|uniref:General stress protein n=1 Tax=Chryseomicrobium palamuruense TaxID=682973 RepID=A0ABV8USD8_9BACL